MTKEQAFDVIVQAINLGYAKGAYNLDSSMNINEAIKTLQTTVMQNNVVPFPLQEQVETEKQD